MTPDPLRARQWPTLVTCSIASAMLIVAVALQAPAASVGLRWTPGPRGRGLEFPPLDISWSMEFADAPPSDGRWRMWLTWALAMLAAIAMGYAIARYLRWRRRRSPELHAARLGADSRAASEADARVLRSGLAAAIETLTDERDPGNAVVKAWQGLQDAAALAGVARRPAETASEFTARLLYRSHRSAAPIAVLLALYHRVRFGEHTPSAGDIASAQQALATLVEVWRADLPERRPPRAAR